MYNNDSLRKGGGNMGLFKNIVKEEDKTVDDLIKNKINELLSQTNIDNSNIEDRDFKINQKYNEIVEDDFRYIGSVSDFSQFPKYSGRGTQEMKPDINGSLEQEGLITLKTWYIDVTSEEYNQFIELFISNGFIASGKEFKKYVDNIVYYAMIDYSESDKRLRIYHTISSDDTNK